jgi:hypothetical protein
LISLNDGGKRFCDVSLSKLKVRGNPYTRPHAGSMDHPGHVCAWKDAAKQRRSSELPTTRSSHALCDHTHHWADRVGEAAGRVLIVARSGEDTGIFRLEDGMRIKVFLASGAQTRQEHRPHVFQIQEAEEPETWTPVIKAHSDRHGSKYLRVYGGTVSSYLLVIACLSFCNQQGLSIASSSS